MEASVRKQVQRRAGDRCEYCRLPQASDPYHLFHVERVRARQHGGTDDPSNLALACHHCNFHKGTNLVGVDPDTNAATRLYHPRHDSWEDHFALEGPRIVGRTGIGRTTVQADVPGCLERTQAAK